MAYAGSREQIYGHVSYAQHGDDLMIANIFHLIGIHKPSYLDLGAHHPTEISNTALLYHRGSRGVNVEANPYLIQAFLTERPEDVNLNCGVAKVTGVQPRVFYMYDNTNGRNSFCFEETQEDLRHPIRASTMLNCMNVNDIVKQFCQGVWPHLLNTDIEGYDYEVIESADFSKNSPIVICTEVRKHKAQPIKNLLSERGYFSLVRCSENLIFVKNEYGSLVR